ncbi:S-methyl-5-thioribose-1-phosphate isomerase [Gemmatimonas sp.]|uniref:S-methyl-5-thioribose-1-phosphate isomerase n=1 Tax=Gemmatimonas sp. TaxID=1962908 RepID=UPI00286D24E8|nr:S-methyl-5-thioribose-1-phosphate isomerase [Gemmatimonas sp.]
MLPRLAVGWSPDHRALRILDQRHLPGAEVIRDLVTLDEVIDAIRTLAVRGAPAIGVAAAIGLVVALEQESEGRGLRAREVLAGYAERLIAARPTAVNLSWAVNRLLAVAGGASDDGLLGALRADAEAIRAEDVAMCDAIGRFGLELIPDGARVLTHCNAGSLATAGIGTALAPVHLAHGQGRRVHVYADETRPLRQGARLTAWELQRAGIPVTVLPDGAAASLLRSGAVDLVIVGADRITANGDVANKVGTYGVALAARAHGIPFYVAAPWSTIDPATATGADIEIEHRHADELGDLPVGARVWNPAFDVTPRDLISGYLTDRGFVKPPFSGATGV